MHDQRLLETLYTNLGWHPERTLTLIGIVQGLLDQGSVKLKKLSLCVSSMGGAKAHLAKVARLFAYQVFDHGVFSYLIWVFIKDTLPERLTIAIDRTNWKFGKTDINFLVATVLIGSVSVPMAWVLLPKCGNSNTREREDLMRRLLKVIPLERIEMVVADREFIGEKWFQFLSDVGIGFTIRIKAGTKVTSKNDQTLTVKEVLALPKSGKSKNTQATLWGQKLWISGVEGKVRKNGKQEPLIVASNRVQGKEALNFYRRRWGIETTFKNLKSGGFRFEETHLTKPDRLLKLFAMAALAIAISVMAGQMLASKIPIKIKRHGRPQWSYFTYGLDYLCFLFQRYKLEPLFKLLNMIFNTMQPIPTDGSH